MKEKCVCAHTCLCLCVSMYLTLMCAHHHVVALIICLKWLVRDPYSIYMCIAKIHTCHANCYCHRV